MAHLVRKTGYPDLVARLNRFPQGAPPSRLLDKILGMLFSEEEARLVARLPLRPFTADKAAKAWGMKRSRAKSVLDRLAARAVLVDIDQDGTTQYVLPPPMAGFFEFSLMRVRHDVDQRVLSELFYQYLNVEEEFIKALFTRGDTQLGRVFVHEPAVKDRYGVHVLDYERASEIIRSASHMGISTCYCRHKMSHIGRACSAPMEICMTFNTSARSLIKYGHARRVDVSEGLALLDLAYEANLVQFGENVRQGVNFICNCCGCCCEGMIAARKFSAFHPVHTSNFIPVISADDCTGCGKCAAVCPVEAMALVSANDPARPRRKTARLSRDVCLGCGLCARACPDSAIELHPLEKRVITPLDTTRRTVIMAIERGTLQHLIFDNQVLFSHRALAALLGVLLRLSPVRRALANAQIKSVYLDVLVDFFTKKPSPDLSGAQGNPLDAGRGQI